MELYHISVNSDACRQRRLPCHPDVILYNVNNSTLESASQVVILTSSSQIASSFSTEASIGSIVIGLLLVRHNRAKQDIEPAEAAEYLHNNSHTIIGLEPMAIVSSLPWALLMWSMVTFFIALLLSSFIISNPATRISIGLISALVFVLTVWCIWTGWESSDGGGATVWLDGFRPSIVRAYRRLVARVKSFVRSAFESLCNCLVFHSRGDNRAITVHSSTVSQQSQGGVGGV